MSDTCWAYGPTGQRCEQTPGHTGSHSVSTLWTDEECITPDMRRTDRGVRRIPIDPTPAPPAAKEEGCAACGWPERTHEANDTGCRTFV